MIKILFHRLMILSSIAIGVSAFAVDSSRVVLQAIQIRETAAVVSWQSIVDTTKYRVYYDEESAIKEGADPLFDTEYTSDTQIEIGKLVAGTRYYFVVRGYDDDGNVTGESYPLHLDTYRSILFDLSTSPLFRDDKTLVLAFTRPVQADSAELSLIVDSSGQSVEIAQIRSSETDYRTLLVTLAQPVKTGQSYTLSLKKISAFGGIPLPREYTVPLKIIYTPGIETSVDTPPQEMIDTGIVPDITPKYDEPVEIDNLPRTGPGAILFFCLALIMGIFTTKKLSRRA